MGNAQPVFDMENDTSVRQKIVKSALHLFTTRGYAATSVREIVEASGVTKPVMYYYFQSKEGLFLHIISEVDKMFNANVENVRNVSDSARGKVIAFFTSMLQMLEVHRDFARLLHSLQFSPQQGAPPFDHRAQHTKFREFITQLIAEGIANGELRKGNISDYTWIFLGIASVSFETTICHPEIAPKIADMQRVLNIVWDSLAPTGEKTPS